MIVKRDEHIKKTLEKVNKTMEDEDIRDQDVEMEIED